MLCATRPRPLPSTSVSKPCVHNRGRIPFASAPRARRHTTVPIVRAASDAAGKWIEDNLGAGAVVNTKFNGGSSWSSTYVYQTQSGANFFVKTALSSDGEKMFKGEALGLQAMYDTQTLRIPKVFHYGPLEGRGRGSAFIVMEYLDFRGATNQAELGRQLARMHLAEPLDENAKKGLFGFAVDNTIGGTPQPNGWMDNWVDFYRERRLKHQLKLAGDRRLSELGNKVCDKLEKFFEGVEVKPSVLHGDLWSGNIEMVDGQPSIFDPATYYGHHEAEFGMSWCAGFGPAFYSAYHELIPKAPGFEQRKQLYQLYHYLNHYNLFGSGYYGSALSILEYLARA